ncbi:unnamed protein product [Vitrella brassicaformis CCMP3155]|uniref:Protein kinase domain-containing protein n=1 Tax=Vitrella brassicaformis (strain CCMP3155) TaxID=1169540 RepID=A0A0G4F519_VITBC|nr:unnamed protein product [Vitrella brassicaformis CCMP3155]|eukprot:CEM06820.1 unnamed protein product [Vitrella brassicaformis CCMP3155]
MSCSAASRFGASAGTAVGPPHVVQELAELQATLERLMRKLRREGRIMDAINPLMGGRRIVPRLVAWGDVGGEEEGEWKRTDRCMQQDMTVARRRSVVALEGTFVMMEAIDFADALERRLMNDRGDPDEYFASLRFEGKSALELFNDQRQGCLSPMGWCVPLTGEFLRALEACRRLQKRLQRAARVSDSSDEEEEDDEDEKPTSRPANKVPKEWRVERGPVSLLDLYRVRAGDDLGDVRARLQRIKRAVEGLGMEGRHFRQVAAAALDTLNHLHGYGFIHGDANPSNFLLRWLGSGSEAASSTRGNSSFEVTAIDFEFTLPIAASRRPVAASRVDDLPAVPVFEPWTAPEAQRDLATAIVSTWPLEDPLRFYLPQSQPIASSGPLSFALHPTVQQDAYSIGLACALMLAAPHMGEEFVGFDVLLDGVRVDNKALESALQGTNSGTAGACEKIQEPQRALSRFNGLAAAVEAAREAHTGQGLHTEGAGTSEAVVDLGIALVLGAACAIPTRQRGSPLLLL